MEDARKEAYLDKKRIEAKMAAERESGASNTDAAQQRKQEEGEEDLRRKQKMADEKKKWLAEQVKFREDLKKAKAVAAKRAEQKRK